MENTVETTNSILDVFENIANVKHLEHEIAITGLKEINSKQLENLHLSKQPYTIKRSGAGIKITIKTA